MVSDNKKNLSFEERKDFYYYVKDRYLTARPGNVKTFNLVLKKISDKQHDLEAACALARLKNLTDIVDMEVGDRIILNIYSNTNLNWSFGITSLNSKNSTVYEVIAKDTPNPNLINITKKAKETRENFKRIAQDTTFVRNITTSCIVLDQKKLVKFLQKEIPELKIKDRTYICIRG